ncbi:hypothetical protein, partial [Acinetobacter baumannii]|uniref:hypothetical protein n=1 Tax=Acinetobacter baumannii TaxID=470 RepID=UPI001D171400
MADELRYWMRIEARWRLDQFRIDYSHHGADLTSSAPSSGLPAEAEALVERLSHDLLPVTRPELFPARAQEHFHAWLQAVVRLDGA